MAAGRWLVALAWSAIAVAQALAADGRLPATGGAMQVEGTAGGGLVPWAVIAGLSAPGQQDWTVGATYADTGDYDLRVVGAQWSWHDRVELSLAHQRLGLDGLRRALELPYSSLHQDVLGAKLRLAGDLIYGDWPQIALGVQYKHLRDFELPQAIGAEDDDGIDAYLAVSRLFLDGPFHRNLLLNGTVRATRANELGLLGFGGGSSGGYDFVFEGSAALFLDPHLAVGAEYRQKPDRLSFARERDWWDAFVAWFPNAHWSIVAAWVDFDSIAGLDGQHGAYLSVQASF